MVQEVPEFEGKVLLVQLEALGSSTLSDVEEELVPRVAESRVAGERPENAAARGMTGQVRSPGPSYRDQPGLQPARPSRRTASRGRCPRCHSEGPGHTSWPRTNTSQSRSATSRPPNTME